MRRSRWSSIFVSSGFLYIFTFGWLLAAVAGEPYSPSRSSPPTHQYELVSLGEYDDRYALLFGLGTPEQTIYLVLGTNAQLSTVLDQDACQRGGVISSNVKSTSKNWRSLRDARLQQTAPKGESSEVVSPRSSNISTTCFDSEGSSTFKTPSYSQQVCLYGRDIASIRAEEKLYTHSGLNKVASGQFTFCLQTRYDSSWSSYRNGQDGVLGLGYAVDSLKYTSVFDLLGSSTKKIVGLRFRLPSEESASTVDFGGYIGNDILWGEAQHMDPPQRHIFPMFSPSICGVGGQTLTMPYGNSFWMALVDTEESGLVLPDELFQTLVAYMPYRCISSTSNNPLGHVICSVPKEDRKMERRRDSGDSDGIPFPAFTFAMSDASANEDIDDASRYLTLPLSSLITEVTEVSSDYWQVRLCVKNMKLSNLNMYTYYDDFITVGTMPLRYFYTVLDMVSYRVGFLQRVVPDSSGLLNCLAPAICAPNEVHNVALNECSPPACNSYYFQELDPLTDKCTFSFLGEMLALGAMATILLLELCTGELYSYLMGQVLAQFSA